MAASVACAGFFFDAEPIGEPGLPALDACALCSKPLARNSDIFMYKGDTPFCSQECRYEQMQLDAVRVRQAGGSRQGRALLEGARSKELIAADDDTTKLAEVFGLFHDDLEKAPASDRLNRRRQRLHLPAGGTIWRA